LATDEVPLRVSVPLPELKLPVMPKAVVNERTSCALL